jgi:hypothetical protein
MRADIGDVLVVAGSESRTGLIIGVVGQDGAPPYVIKWLSDGSLSSAFADLVAGFHPGFYCHGARFL